MNPSTGLMTALNKMREMSVEEGSVYHQYFPIVTPDTNIGEWGQPIFGDNYQVTQEAFFGLLRRIAFAAVNTKLYRNPLTMLEGENLPLGYAGEEIYVNPVEGRQFNVNDFAGLLQKYEADIKTQILTVNMDLQYPVTLTRDKIRTAFVSWTELEAFITGIINALYNGAYIKRFQYTKALVPAAFKDNKVQYVVHQPVTNEATGKALAKELRKIHTLFQMPSTQFNAWAKIGGRGRPVTTWTDPEDIVLLIRADVMASVDVDVLAAAFNMDKANFLGRVITIDNFNLYSDTGRLVYDGSNITGIIADKSWFKIRTQDMALDQFFNASNRSWQYFLNDVRMYSYSLFANAVVLTTEAPSVPATAATFEDADVKMADGTTASAKLNVTPVNTTDVPAFVSNDTSVVEVAADPADPFTAVLTAKGAGTTTITATVGEETATLNVTVSA